MFMLSRHHGVRATSRPGHGRRSRKAGAQLESEIGKPPYCRSLVPIRHFRKCRLPVLFFLIVLRLGFTRDSKALEIKLRIVSLVL
jgi:hypothetical protein